jgi:glycosyltransferase involved in cell wall biosynthesis
MRLLLVTDSYPPFVGGADRQIQMIASAMQSAGNAVEVATPWQTGLPEVEEENGVVVHRIRGLTTRVRWFSRDPKKQHHPPFPDPVTTLALRRIVRRLRPDAVHSYGWITYSAAAALLGSSIPLVVSTRDYGNVCAVRNYLYYRGYVCSGPGPLKCLRCATVTYTQDDAGNALFGRADAPVGLRHRLRGFTKAVAAVVGIRLGRFVLMRHLRGLHTVSQFVRSVMDRHLLRLGRSRQHDVTVDAVIPSFLPPGETGVPDAALLRRLPADPYILFVGGLQPQKGIWPLLGAYQRLRAPAPPLVLLGPTSYKSPTRFPDGVVTPGGTTHATVMAAWERAMFGVVPSVGAETFGNVVTEAMSQGRPVVGSRLGGIVDIIEDGVSGLLVPAGDEEALAAAMQRLIDDPVLRSALGEAARKRAELFAASRVLPQFEAMYQELVAGERRG